jgi:hypothetical protein
VEFDLDIVGGVTGIAITDNPVGRVSVSISKYNSEGYIGSIRKGLRGTILHELHHIAHGWVMEGNKFGPGIYIAVANEGLASVFSEILTGDSFLSHDNKEDVDQWIEEILKLPLDADYMHWVSGTHPDGRSFIGYKAGKYLVYKAMFNSDKNILELSKLPISLLYTTAGY